MGRPKQGEGPYRDTFPNICRRLGAAGKSEAQIAAHFGVRRSSMRAWGKVHPEFQEALLDAHDLSLAWWEDRGQRSLTRREFNTALYNKIIAARFRREYSDRQVLAGDPDAPLVHTIVRRIVKADAR